MVSTISGPLIDMRCDVEDSTWMLWARMESTTLGRNTDVFRLPIGQLNTCVDHKCISRKYSPLGTKTCSHNHKTKKPVQTLEFPSSVSKVRFDNRYGIRLPTF